MVCNIKYYIDGNKSIFLLKMQTYFLCIRYGGTIYGFIPSSDIINNLMVGVLSKQIIEASKGNLDETGYLGLFLCLGVSAMVAFISTLPFPSHPSPRSITYIFKWPKFGSVGKNIET